MNMKRYAFCGAHGVGKSTILRAIKPYIVQQCGLQLIDNSSNARHLKEMGHAINDSGKEFVQYVVAASHIGNFARPYSWFADRCVVDGCAYMMESDVDHTCWESITAQTFYFRSLYDQIFHIPIEFDMPEDGYRKVDEEYRYKVARNIHGLLSPLTNVTVVKGSVEERVAIIKNFFDNL
jgi:predicted ATPase